MSRVIGLTGGIASGKSTVAGMLAARGAFVVDADQLARRAVAPGTPALQEIASEFGKEAIGGDGTLDRQRLGKVVFADPQARERLNRIVHPRVLELSREEIAAAQAAGAELVVYDVPLLYETGRQDEFSATLLVYCDPVAQLQRLQQRSELELEAAEARIGAQMPMERKRELATWVIDNSGPLSETEAEVARLWAAELARTPPTTAPDLP